MKNFWKLATIFFIGAFSSLLMVFLTKKPQVVINAETYIEKQNQEIGKIKQKGKGNIQETEITQKLTGKQKREERQTNRKNKKGLKVK